MRLAGAPVKLWKFDCEAFYKRMGRQNAQLWRVAMMRPEGVQVEQKGDELVVGAWATVQQVAAGGAGRLVEVPLVGAGPQRYYRVVSPSVP